MVRDLVVSVANRYPAGSLLTMPNTGDQFALRPFSGTGTELRDTPSLMILDGQQRLTSLYQSLFSVEGIRGPYNTTHFVYLDVKELMKYDASTAQDEQTFSDNVFTVQVNKQGQRLRYSGLREFVDITTREQELEHGVLPLYTVFNPDELFAWREAFADRYAEGNLGRYKDALAEWDAEVMPWVNRMRDYRFPVIELNKDMPLHAICHIFEKVNSTGVPLTVFELCTAILWSKGFKLNDAWDQAKTKLSQSQALRMQGELEGAQFLQVISLLSTLNRKRMAPESRISVNCRREELLKLRKETVEEWWDIATTSYKDASKFMESQGVVAKRVLPYGSMLLPLAAILGYLKYTRGPAIFGHAWPKIERWYWCSVFTQRYSSSVEATSATDLEQVIGWVEGGDEPEVVRNFYFAADRLQDFNNIRNAMYKGILCLLAKNGAKDFGGEGTLSANLFYDTQQDHHHIFPVNALATLGIQDQRVHSIVNKTLIGASPNRSIGGRLPSSYVETMRTRMGGDHVDTILRSHLIDPAALSSDDWENFFLIRREELKGLIQSVCGGQVQDFSDGKSIELPARLARLQGDVREVERELRSLIAYIVDSDWLRIPDHIRPGAERRIDLIIRDNPGVNQDNLATVEGKLAYCDLRELESIITSKQLWDSFSSIFRNKENLSARFRQLAPFRNAEAHVRDTDELTRIDAEAAVLWFKGAISTVERITTSTGSATTFADEDGVMDTEVEMEEGSISEESIPAAD